MKDLLKNLYDITERESGLKPLKVTITKGGLKKEIEASYRSGGDYPQDTRVYIVVGPASNLVALDKLLAAADYCGSVGHSMTLKLFADGDGNFRPKVVFPKFDIETLFSEEQKKQIEGDEVGFGDE